MPRVRVVRVQPYHPPCGYPVEVGTVRTVSNGETDPRVLDEAVYVEVDRDARRAETDWMHTRLELADALDEFQRGQAPPTGRQVLGLHMDDNDSGANTVGGYLTEVLATLWREGEGFSPKSPFGNSSWAWDLYRPLVAAGFIESPFDADGYVRAGADPRPGARLIEAAIEELGKP